MTRSCEGEPVFREHEGQHYCIFHFPCEEKSAAFYKALQNKLDKQDFDFRGFWFPAKSNFSYLNFSEPVDFSQATFNTDAFFFEVVFTKYVSFEGTIFKAAAHFREATFQWGVNFAFAKFSATADFSETSFDELAGFRDAIFEDHVVFSSKRKPASTQTLYLDLQFARIEKPEHFSFHTLTLNPGGFVNVDARKFQFTNVEWHWQATKDEIERLQRSHVPAPNRMLAIACRQLAVNAEENHRYEEASKFRYMAMDARRLEHWWGMDLRRLSWWYWFASGYGERIGRAAIMLLFFVFFLSALVYTQVGFARWEPRIGSESEATVVKRDETGAPLKFPRALTYSAAVMTFQRPEPRPATTAAQTIVLLETILGPVQAALLALAIRRKFMR